MEAIAVIATFVCGFFFGVLFLGAIFAYLVIRDDKNKKALREAAYGEEPVGRVAISGHDHGPILI